MMIELTKPIVLQRKVPDAYGAHAAYMHLSHLPLDVPSTHGVVVR
jgi:hypothetical protein